MIFLLNSCTITKLLAVIFVFIFALHSTNSIALEAPTDNSAEQEWEWKEEESQNILSWGYYHNLDLYYANAGAIFNISDHAIPDIGDASEGEVYLDLFKRSGLPQYVLFEFSIYPMPIVGVYTREEHEDFYQDAELRSNFNWLESVTAGFEEPYALSVFFNNMVAYGAEGDLENSNRGFMGYLVSVGNYHIQRNRLVEDNWLELEWKIKGDIKRDEERLSWSFRIGGKFHEHPEIVDSLYVVLKRNQVATNKPILSWLFNSGVEFTYSVNQENFNSIGLQLMLEKNFPIKIGSTVFSLGFGVIHENSNKYRGELKDTQEKDNQTYIVIRPSIHF